VSLPWLDYGGIIAGDPTVAHDLLEAAILQAREDKASWIELRSMKKLRPDMPTRDDKVTFELELGPPESVWSRLDAKVRNQVRKAQKADLTCHFGREELLPEFYRIFARNMRDLGTPVWGMGFFQVILAAFEKTSEIAVVQKGNYGIAAGLTIGFKDTLAMPSASALRGFRSLCPNNLLYWEVIKRACETGYRCFDFGRSTIGSGTYNFKKHWGPTIKPLHWQYVLLNGNKIPQLNPSNPKFRLAVAIWKRLPLALATWLGPRIARHLP
jgi:FemAB-related protein (PEP-CTERM system-associated)